MEFVLLARDGADSLPKRMATRSSHMAGLKTERSKGSIRDGGAILDKTGAMVGSVVLCEFTSREELDMYLSKEIYAISGVWEKVEILEMRFVDWPTLMQ